MVNEVRPVRHGFARMYSLSNAAIIPIELVPFSCVACAQRHVVSKSTVIQLTMHAAGDGYHVPNMSSFS